MLVKLFPRFTVALLILMATETTLAKDYPLFGSYPGAKIVGRLEVDYGYFHFPGSADISAEKISVTGDLYRHRYLIPKVSTLKVYENYMDALRRLGFSVIYQCKLEECGDTKNAQKLGTMMVLNASLSNDYRDPYYLLAEKNTAAGKIHAGWFIGGYQGQVAVQQVVVEEEPLEADLIQVSADYIGSEEWGITPVEKASAEELAKDHPLLNRYPGAKLHSFRNVDHERIDLIPAPNAPDQNPITLEGDLSRHYYYINKASTLKVFENYQQALVRGGFSILSQCREEECGTKEQQEKFRKRINHSSGSMVNPNYLLAKKNGQNGDIYVSILLTALDYVQVHQTVMRTKALVTDLVTVNSEQLHQQLEMDGKALIYGIYFDTGAANIKPESKPALDAIAELLDKNPELLLYVVGHTDDTGTNTANRTLSQSRANAVVQALTSTYKIAGSRLQAEGVGPYAPASNNTSEAGKTLNRRVELVKRLQ
jgi:outer membrane protein OmpA-like peptidoglycan-associated protein